MDHVSYKQRDCRDQAKINDFLKYSSVGIVGIMGDEYPYTVPVNYVWLNGRIYFHGMGSGKKVRMLSDNARTSFTVYKEFGTTTDPMPCKSDTSYLSVMLFGHASKVTDFSEAAEALQLILDKYTPGFYQQKMSASLVEKYRSAMDGNAVAVFRIDPVHITAKENAADPSALYQAHQNRHQP